MMKTKLIVLMLIFLKSIFLFGQNEWFQIGTEWYFNKQVELKYPAHGYDKYIVVKDTIVEQRNIKLIQHISVNYIGLEESIDSLYAYEEDSKVYYGDGHNFHLIYDFTSIEGDTLNLDLEYDNCDSYSPIIVDSVGSVFVNSVELVVQYASQTFYTSNIYGYDIEAHYKFIETIGNEMSMIFTPKCVNSEEFVYSGLRCFHSTNVEYKNDWWNTHYPDVSCDSLINEDDTYIYFENSDSIVLYPNPTNRYIHINDENSISKIEIYSSMGMLIANFNTINESGIDIQRLEVGYYFVRVISKNGNISVIKILKI